MKRQIVRIVAKLSTAAAMIVNIVQPVAATHGLLGCEGDGSLRPLVLMIHNIANLMFVLGALAAVVSLAYAAIMIMFGSEDAKRRAILRVQRVLMGVGLLVLAPFIVQFLIAPFNICGGV